MKRFWAAVIAALVSGVPALAAGYDDFTAGMTANLRGEYAAAITAFSAALAAPDLVAAYKAPAYRGRAVAYLNAEVCDKAKADLQTYQGLKPDDPSVANLYLWVNLCLKDTAAARKEFEALAKGDPKAGDLWDYARLQWRYGLFDDAFSTSREAFKLIEKKTELAAYVLLWQAVTAQRAGKFDATEIAAELAATGRSDWPKPLIDLYLGRATPQSVQKEAESWRPEREDAQRCEANFYTAEWHLGRNDQASATPLLIEVTRSCPIDFIELSAAKTELKRLGVPVPKE